MPSPPVAAGGNEGDRAGARPPPTLYTLYKSVATPVIFVSFLISLAWVEFRNAATRTHLHAETPRRLPRWLHTVVYRGEPYTGPGGSSRSASASGGARGDASAGAHWYYHSKQRKLLRMEAAEAFQIRTTVLCVMGLAFAVTVWAAWRAASWAVAWSLSRWLP